MFNDESNKAESKIQVVVHNHKPDLKLHVKLAPEGLQAAQQTVVLSEKSNVECPEGRMNVVFVFFRIS